MVKMSISVPFATFVTDSRIYEPGQGFPETKEARLGSLDGTGAVGRGGTQANRLN